MVADAQKRDTDELRQTLFDTNHRINQIVQEGMRLDPTEKARIQKLINHLIKKYERIEEIQKMQDEKMVVLQEATSMLIENKLEDSKFECDEKAELDINTQEFTEIPKTKIEEPPKSTSEVIRETSREAKKIQDEEKEKDELAVKIKGYMSEMEEKHFKRIKEYEDERKRTNKIIVDLTDKIFELEEKNKTVIEKEEKMSRASELEKKKDNVARGLKNTFTNIKSKEDSKIKKDVI